MASSYSKFHLRSAVLFILLFICSDILAQLPSIGSFSPASGTAGTIVTITGTNFSTTPGNNIVYFGPVRAVVSAATTTTLTVQVPAGATYYPITTTVGNLTACSMSSFLPIGHGNSVIDANSIRPTSTSPTFTGFRALAGGDLDGDGLPDLVSCNYNLGNITIYPNNSVQGQFSLNSANAITYAASYSPMTLAVGDLDGDGKQDIVAGSPSHVSIFLNTSTPHNISFAPKYDLPTAAFVEGLAIGDLDNDGKPDLVVTGSEGTGKCYVYRNIGTAGNINLPLVQTISVKQDPFPPTITDIDGDGRRDIIFPNMNGSCFSVLQNTASGRFLTFNTTPYTFGSGNGLFSLAVGDLDGDGKPDAVMVNGNDSIVTAYRNTSTTGSFSFTTGVPYRIQGVANQVTLGDFDGDGLADIAAVNSYRYQGNNLPNIPLNTISLLKNTSTTGSIRFNPDVRVITGQSPINLLMGDFDADSVADVAVLTDGAIALVEHRPDTAQTVGASFTPASARAGNTVTISGNFTGVTDVSFGGTPAASYTVVSSTIINAVVGNGSSGDIVITDASGTQTLHGFTFIGPPPVIRSFTPGKGGQGTTVTIYGSYFTGASAVTFGDSAVASFTITSDTSIQAILGNLPIGDLAVSVKTLSGIATRSAFYTGPTITSFAPHAGNVGASVTITGTNFSTTPTNNIVLFGSVKATVSASTPTSITVIVPAGASYQPISVSNNHFTAYTSSPFTVTFDGAGPTLTPSSFGPKIENATNRTPYSTGAADMDGDGLVDIAVLNAFDQNISIYRNRVVNGATTFGPKFDISASSGAIKMTVGDLNGDGLPDIVVANTDCGHSTVSVYRNVSTPGTIAFATRTDYGSGKTNCSSPENIMIADLDGDGLPDLAIANLDNTMTVLKNTGTAGSLSFVFNNNYTTGPGAQSLATADLNGDNIPDIIVANTSSNDVSIFQNTSTPGAVSFAAPVSHITGSGPFDVAIGDLNNDGKPDFAAVNANDHTLTIFRNTGANGTIDFADSVSYPLGAYYPQNVAISDIDGDGHPDIVLASPDESYVLAFKNLTSGNTFSFAPSTTYQAGNGIIGLTIADVTGDGAPDIITASHNSNTFSVLPNWVNAPHISSFTPIRGGKGTIMTITGTNFTGVTGVTIGPQPAISYTVNSSTSITAVVNQTLAGDVVVTTTHGAATLPGFTFTMLPTVNTFSPAAGPLSSTVTINGSNFSPLAGRNTVYLGSVKADITAATANTLTIKVPGGSSYQPLAVYVDSIAAFPVQPFVLNWPGGGSIDSITFSARTDYTVGTSPIAFTFGDLDGDGYSDLIATNNGTRITVYHNKALVDTLLFDAGTDYTTGNNPTYIALGDVDGDGKLDLVVANLTVNTISILRNTSTTGNITFAPKVDIGNLALPSSIAIADIDGDGKPDIMTINRISNGTFSVFKNNCTVGNIAFAPVTGGSVGSNPSSMAVGDLDGDGIPDAAILNSTGSTISLLRNTSTYGFFSFAGYPDIPTLNGPENISMGDFDGDGKPDLAVANYNANLVSIFKNTSTMGSLSFAPMANYPAGIHPSVVSIGDLDGDGKVDIAAIGVGNTNTVSVLKNTSSNGIISFATNVDYATGNTPKDVYIGDLHHNGQNDLATINMGSNNVSVFRYNPSIVSHPAPTITSFNPTQAHKTDTVTITGTHFNGITTVSFGGVSARAFTIVSDSLLTAIIDTGATGSVVINGPNGSDTLAGFTFIGTPPVVVPPTTTPSVFQLKKLSGLTLYGQPYLEWEIANDSSITYYIIEQSTDTIHFNPVGSVKALQKDTATYSFNDPSPRIGINYYMLKIEDTAGNATYSSIIKIQMAGTPETLTLHPNPATDHITVTLPSTMNPSQFMLVDMNGKVIKIVPVATGVSDVTIDLIRFTNGVYKLIWSDGANFSYKTILIMRQ